MKAIRIRTIGGPEVLEYVDVPTPEPAAREVLVKADSIGVNMPEIMVRRGTYRWSPPLPAIPGIEMSGVVEAVGAQVRAFRPGQPVYVSARELPERGGCYAEYIVAPEEALYAVPPHAELEAAATLAGYQVAWHVLHNATRGFRFESVLVSAAGGGIGSACVQLAVAAGKRVIGVAGSEEKLRFVRGLGAAAGINYRNEDVVQRVQELTDGEGVDLVLDSVGGRGFPRLFDCAARLGMVILYGRLDGRPESAPVFDALDRLHGRSLALRMFSMHVFDHDRAARRACTTALLELLGSRAIRPSIHERVPLAETARAHRLLESGAVLGNLILKP